MRIIEGEYTGDGTNQRSVDIGEEVTLIVIWNSTFDTADYPSAWALLFENGHYAGDTHGAKYLQHTGSGFTTTVSGKDRYNYSGYVYKYLAFVLGS